MYSPQAPRSPQPTPSEINISENERTLSLVGGAALTVFALLRRGTISIPAFLAGIGLIWRSVTGKSMVYEALGMNPAIKTNESAVAVPHQQGIHVQRAVTVNRSAADLYNFWREPTNLPHVLGYVESVQVIDNTRAHWTIKLPGNIQLEFDAEVYTDVPNEVISWRSLPNADVQNAGSVRFRPAPLGRGTEVHLTVEFVPPGGPIAQAVLKLFGEAPQQYIGQYLREFKQMMETGEKSTNDGQPSGRQKEGMG